jgi:hypothetical protein
MAKTKTKSHAKMVRKQPKRSVQHSSLDPYALQYARLLADPCNGPLVNGIAGDGQGGIVSRFEGDFVINGGGTETAAFLAFVPGVNQYYTSGGLLLADNTAFTLTTSNAFNYLANTGNIGSYRCLSACVQVFWPGTENNRAGVISLGQFNLGDITAGAINTGYVRTGSQYIERTPNTMSELKWTPTQQDMSWNEINANDTVTPALSQKHGALVISGAGLTIGTGLRVRIVGVYEWKPAISSGLGNQVKIPRSKNSLTDVLRWLEGTGYSVYNGAIQAANTASSIYSAGKAVARLGYGTAKMMAIMA